LIPDTLSNSARFDFNPLVEVYMKRIAAVAVSFILAAAPAAFAEPLKMSEAQLDQIVGGLADVSVTVGDITINPNVQVSVLGG
jgi:hypothetical protein